MKTNYLPIERPDSTATVDFLDVVTCVTLTVEDGKLRINVRVSDAEDSSYFREEDFEVDVTPA